jgi:hypothetical protein
MLPPLRLSSFQEGERERKRSTSLSLSLFLLATVRESR